MGKGIVLTILFAGLVLMTATVQATQLNFDFQVTATEGPLNGTQANGTFAFDSAIIPAGGGSVNQPLLTDLDFVWNGIAYDENSANLGWLGFDPVGELVRFSFGNHCEPGTCRVTTGTNDWFVYAPGNDSFFLYSTPESTAFFSGELAWESSNIPEPATFILLGAGLAGVGLLRRRFKN